MFYVDCVYLSNSSMRLILHLKLFQRVLLICRFAYVYQRIGNRIPVLLYFQISSGLGERYRHRQLIPTNLIWASHGIRREERRDA